MHGILRQHARPALVAGLHAACHRLTRDCRRPQLTEGPIKVGDVFESSIDFKGRATPVKWKVKTLERPHEVMLKGKMHVNLHHWYWPAKIKGARPCTAPRCDAAPAEALTASVAAAAATHELPVKVLDKYFVQDGPGPNTSVVR